MSTNKPSLKIIKAYLILLIGFALFRSFRLHAQITSPYGHHYYFLSHAFSNFRIEVTPEIKKVFNTPELLANVYDYALINNRYFVYLGPFPALLGIFLLPFGPQLHYFTLFLISFLITYFYLKKIVDRFLKENSFLTSLLILFASPILTALVYPGPWYLTALFASGLGLAFCWLYGVKKKIGSLFLILPLFLTRPTTIFYLLIPLIEALGSKKKKKLITTLIVGILAVGLFAGYNCVRFNHPLKTGYGNSLSNPADNYGKSRIQVPFSLKFWLSNAVYQLINPPYPNIGPNLRYAPPYFILSRFGIGLLFAMPWILIYFINNPFKRKKDWPYLVAVLAIFVSILSFSGEGSFSIGPRYACDYIPLIIFLVLRWVRENKQKKPLFRKLLLTSFVLNLYFFLLRSSGFQYLQYPCQNPAHKETLLIDVIHTNKQMSPAK